MQIEQSVGDLEGLRTVGRKPSKPSSRSDRFAPPAVCNVEQLLNWAYGRQEVHRHLKREVSGAAWSGAMDSVVKVQMNNIHGGRLSGGGMPPGLPVGSFGGEDDVHPDALTVHSALAILDELSVGLVIKHGWEGTRPDAGGELLPLQPLRSGKMRVRMQNDSSGNAIACVLNKDELLYNADVLMARLTYTHWWEALLLLQDECSRLLPHIEVGFTPAPMEPWRIVKKGD